MDPRPEMAEALGTFALVLVGVGAIMADAQGAGLGTLGIALAFGSVVLAMVYALGPMSGAHLNPAITIAFAATGHFPWSRVPSYVAAQSLGASVAAGFLATTIGPVADLGATRLHDIGVVPGILIEIAATFFLALVIIAVATDPRAPRGVSSLAIGFAVALGALVAGPFTGGSMNPARSLGPALASGDLSFLWLYLSAPVVGALLAMTTYAVLRPAVRATRAPATVGTTGPTPLAPEEEHA